MKLMSTKRLSLKNSEKKKKKILHVRKQRESSRKRRSQGEPKKRRIKKSSSKIKRSRKPKEFQSKHAKQQNKRKKTVLEKKMTKVSNKTALNKMTLLFHNKSLPRVNNPLNLKEKNNASALKRDIGKTNKKLVKNKKKSNLTDEKNINVTNRLAPSFFNYFSNIIKRTFILDESKQENGAEKSDNEKNPVDDNNDDSKIPFPQKRWILSTYGLSHRRSSYNSLDCLSDCDFTEIVGRRRLLSFYKSHHVKNTKGSRNQLKEDTISPYECLNLKDKPLPPGVRMLNDKLAVGYKYRYRVSNFLKSIKCLPSDESEDETLGEKLLRSGIKPKVGYEFRYRISKMMASLADKEKEAILLELNEKKSTDIRMQKAQSISQSVNCTANENVLTMLLKKLIIKLAPDLECEEWEDVDEPPEVKLQPIHYGDIGFKYRYRLSKKISIENETDNATKRVKDETPDIVLKPAVGYKYRYRISKMLAALNDSVKKYDEAQNLFNDSVVPDIESSESRSAVHIGALEASMIIPVIELYPEQLHHVGYEYRYKRSRKMQALGIDPTVIEERRSKIIRDRLNKNLTELLQNTTEVPSKAKKHVVNISYPVVLDYSRLTQEEKQVGYEYRYRISKKFMNQLPLYLMDDLKNGTYYPQSLPVDVNLGYKDKELKSRHKLNKRVLPSSVHLQKKSSMLLKTKILNYAHQRLTSLMRLIKRIVNNKLLKRPSNSKERGFQQELNNKKTVDKMLRHKRHHKKKAAARHKKHIESKLMGEKRHGRIYKKNKSQKKKCHSTTKSIKRANAFSKLKIPERNLKASGEEFCKADENMKIVIPKDVCPSRNPHIYEENNHSNDNGSFKTSISENTMRDVIAKSSGVKTYDNVESNEIGCDQNIVLLKATDDATNKQFKAKIQSCNNKSSKNQSSIKTNSHILRDETTTLTHTRVSPLDVSCTKEYEQTASEMTSKNLVRSKATSEEDDDEISQNDKEIMDKNTESLNDYKFSNVNMSIFERIRIAVKSLVLF